MGELVGARLIAHAGSLLNLAKQPASTVQILGAEKALFRALKTKHEVCTVADMLVSFKQHGHMTCSAAHLQYGSGKSLSWLFCIVGVQITYCSDALALAQTPKYGLIYHASLIGQSQPKFKGKISRVLAAKCSLSIRVDALGEHTDAHVGLEGRAKVMHGLGLAVVCSLLLVKHVRLALAPGAAQVPHGRTWLFVETYDLMPTCPHAMILMHGRGWVLRAWLQIKSVRVSLNFVCGCDMIGA